MPCRTSHVRLRPLPSFSSTCQPLSGSARHDGSLPGIRASKNSSPKVTKRGVAEVMGERDGFREVFIEAEGAGDGARDLCHFNGVRKAGGEVVAHRGDEDTWVLCLRRRNAFE